MKKKLAVVIAVVILLLLNLAIYTQEETVSGTVTLSLSASTDETSDYTIWYHGKGEVFSEANSVTGTIESGTQEVLTVSIPSDTTDLRIDFGDNAGEFVLGNMSVTDGDDSEEIELSAFDPSRSEDSNDIAFFSYENGEVTVEALEGDPYITASVEFPILAEKMAIRASRQLVIKKAIYFLLVNGIALAAFFIRKRVMLLMKELWDNRKLIKQLAQNDFKTRYAGSVFGVIWAFVQPVVTVLVYWFVFGRLGSGPVVSRTGEVYPFVLWLIAGLVPWFFFQDALSGGTGALQEYSYLVKKVVFKISILPIVKEISAVYVHLFFIALTMVLYLAAGFFPDLYYLQVIYYSGALFVYTLGLIYLTSSIVVFFKDLTQIISIVLQVQVWMTPIMWNFTAYSSRLPGWALSLLKLNPLFYIVQGYRDTFMDKVWFWEHLDMTVYFWGITVLFFAIGTFVFKRLKVHFADIL